jgi:hypothetical protein
LYTNLYTENEKEESSIEKTYHEFTLEDIKTFEKAVDD